MNMATTALRAAVAGITSVVDSAAALINDLASRLREAIDSDDWDAVEELTAELESNQAELAAAVAANTVAADEPAAPAEEESPLVQDGEPETAVDEPVEESADDDEPDAA